MMKPTMLYPLHDQVTKDSNTTHKTQQNAAKACKPPLKTRSIYGYHKAVASCPKQILNGAGHYHYAA